MAGDSGQDAGLGVRRPVRWGAVVAAVLLSAGTVILVWFAAVPFGPIVCPAIDPAPQNCIVNNRAGTALIVTAVVAVLGVATLLLAVLAPRRGRGFVIAGIVLLAIAPFASYLTVAWSPGFDPGQHAVQTAPERSIGDPIATWGTAADGQPHLVISADGTISGNDGCNSLSGTWVQPDPTASILFDDVIMSLMMCSHVDTWLASGRSALVAGDVLHVLDDSGAVIGTLVRESAES